MPSFGRNGVKTKLPHMPSGACLHFSFLHIHKYCKVMLSTCSRWHWTHCCLLQSNCSSRFPSIQLRWTRVCYFVISRLIYARQTLELCRFLEEWCFICAIQLCYFISSVASPLSSVFISNNRFINKPFSVSWSNKHCAKIPANFGPVYLWRTTGNWAYRPYQKRGLFIRKGK
jgi:hypothetical protein